MPVNYTITVHCENGHTQEVRVDGLLGPEWVRNQAAFLDGSSRFYLEPAVRTGGVIGRCGICGSRIRCGVTDEEPRWPMTGVGRSING